MNDFPAVEPQSVPGAACHATVPGRRAIQAANLAEIERVTGASFALTEALRTSIWRAPSASVGRAAEACYRDALSLHARLLDITARIEAGAP